MTLISQFTKPTSTHRWLAIVAMVVFVAGKSFHVHQECSSCCAAHATPDAPSSGACPFGCQHHQADSESGDSKERGDGEQSHDEHQCAVCSVLAAAVECPFVLELPECHALIQPAVLLTAQLPDCVEVRLIRLRGPPVA